MDANFPGIEVQLPVLGAILPPEVVSRAVKVGLFGHVAFLVDLHHLEGQQLGLPEWDFCQFTLVVWYNE